MNLRLGYIIIITILGSCFVAKAQKYNRIAIALAKADGLELLEDEWIKSSVSGITNSGMYTELFMDLDSKLLNQMLWMNDLDQEITLRDYREKVKNVYPYLMESPQMTKPYYIDVIEFIDESTYVIEIKARKQIIIYNGDYTVIDDLDFLYRIKSDNSIKDDPFIERIELLSKFPAKYFALKMNQKLTKKLTGHKGLDTLEVNGKSYSLSSNPDSSFYYLVLKTNDLDTMDIQLDHVEVLKTSPALVHPDELGSGITEDNVIPVPLKLKKWWMVGSFEVGNQLDDLSGEGDMVFDGFEGNLFYTGYGINVGRDLWRGKIRLSPLIGISIKKIEALYQNGSYIDSFFVEDNGLQEAHVKTTVLTNVEEQSDIVLLQGKLGALAEFWMNEDLSLSFEGGIKINQLIRSSYSFTAKADYVRRYQDDLFNITLPERLYVEDSASVSNQGDLQISLNPFGVYFSSNLQYELTPRVLLSAGLTFESLNLNSTVSDEILVRNVNDISSIWVTRRARTFLLPSICINLKYYL